MYIKQLTNSEFKKFSTNFYPSSIYQTVEYAFTMNEQDYYTYFLGLVDEDKIKAASLILIHKINGFKYAYAPRGFLIDYNNFELLEIFTNELKKFLGKNDVVAIKINPLVVRNIYDKDYKIVRKNIYYDKIFENLKKLNYHHLGYNSFFEALKPRFEAVIDLEKKVEDLFMNIDKSFRTKIRSADSDGIKIIHGDEKDLDYLDFQTKKKYPRGLNYFKDLYSFFHKDNLIDFYYSKLDTATYLKKTQKLYETYETKLYSINEQILIDTKNQAKLIEDKIKLEKTFQKYKKQLEEAITFLRENPNGIILSSALVIRFGGEVYLLMDGYDPKYKKFNAKHLLLWKLIGTYSNLNYKKFNLGGIIDTRNNSSLIEKYKGLNEFKLKFGALITEYVGDFELVTNNAKYFMYMNSKELSNIFKRK